MREQTTGYNYQVTPAGVVTDLIPSGVGYGHGQFIQLADGTYLSIGGGIGSNNGTSNLITRIFPPTVRTVSVGGGGAAGGFRLHGGGW